MNPHSSSVLRARILRSSSVAGAVALALATLPRAQATTLIPGAPIGGPITVSALVTLHQRNPVTAMDATGDFVVAWEKENPVTNHDEIFAEDYAADGLPQGSAFQVSSDTSGFRNAPSVAMDAAGDFVVAWETFVYISSTSRVYDIYAQRYASNGTPLGSNFLVNSDTSAYQAQPSVAMDATGDFVVAWEKENPVTNHDEIFAEDYAADGLPQGSAFQVSSDTSVNQNAPSVAMDAAGDFVVAWESFDRASPTSQDDIYAQRYASNGTPLGSNFLVNSYTSGNQETPSVAMDAAGDFVVAWKSYGQIPSARYYGDIYAQRYASDGTPLGSNFLVNSDTSVNQKAPSVAMDAAGDFVVAWESYERLGTSRYDVYAQRYSASGAALGSEFLVNPANLTAPFSTESYNQPSVAMDATGDFVVGWREYAYSYNYTTYTSYHYYGIGAQRYQGESTASVDLTVTGVSSESTVIPGSPFSVSFEVVNRTIPSFETSDAYLNSFID
ncbi:MAG: hypothetical protein ACYCVU_08650, partial [Gammaproteobacteria bacterium]